MTTSGLIEIPLAIDLRFPNHPPYVRDLSRLPCQSLARDLARALLERTNTSGTITSPATVKEFLTALRHLCRWMGDRGFDGGAGQLSDDLVFDYWRHTTARIEANTRKLLAQIEAKRPGTLHPDVASHLDGVRLHRVPSSTPHEPYSAGEAQRLLDVCKGLVTAAEARSAIADALVIRGSVHGDASAGDVAWLDEANLARFIDTHGPHDASKLADRLGYKLWRTQLLGIGRLHEVLFPGYDEVLAFRILLGLQAGICPEGIDGLTTDCIEWLGETEARISWFKGRASGRQSQVFASRGSWSPGRLIERWLAVSARARRFALDPGALWLFCQGRHLSIHKPSGRWDARGGFITRHALVADDGQPLKLHFAGLRATYFARHDRAWNGALRIDANHSRRVEGDHYLAQSRPSDAIEATIEAAQREAVRKAATAPLTLISPEELDRLDADPVAAASRLSMTTDAAGQLVAGERDVFAAACKDFHNSPFGEPGSPCPAPVWTCLFCPLAVFTPSKVPNLLRLRAHLDRQWVSLPASEWMSLYGAAHLRLERDILAGFGVAVVEAAQAIIDTDGEDGDLYLRPEEQPWPA